MKGFIELTGSNGERLLVNINHIVNIQKDGSLAIIRFSQYRSTGVSEISVVQSYEEVKVLIEESLR